LKIGIIGTGYVGLVAGAGLADFGNEVTCCDKDISKIDFLKSGGIPIYEIGLSDLMKRNIEKGRMNFSSDLRQTVESSQVIFLAVGTPESANGEPDLIDMMQISEEIGNYIREYKIIAVKSTVPIGTFRRINENVKKSTSSEFDVVSNPEFLREGSAVQDFLLPNRIVLGVSSTRAEKIMREVYRGLYLIETPMIVTDNITAEMIKYACNCFLATKISFINEMAKMCDHFGADVVTVAKAMGMDGRIGPKFLHPSPGFGGSCLTKDVAALISMGEKAGIDLKIPKAVLGINREQRELVIHKAVSLIGPLSGKRFAILGLSFKGNTDDIRDSPTLDVVERLLLEGAIINAYDPAAIENFRKQYPQITYAPNAYESCRDTDIVVFMTEWNEFRELDLCNLRKVMCGDALLDTRNIFPPDVAKKAGFRYQGFGRN
jgi:UDPglucose 6-dehydrogenase